MRPSAAVTIALTVLCAAAAAGCGGHKKSSRSPSASASTAAPTTSATGPAGTPGGSTPGPVTSASTTPPPPATHVLVLQPDPVDGKDTYVRSGAAFAGVNYGRSPELLVGDDGSNAASGGSDMRSFLEFRTAALPAGASVRRAVLSLHLIGSRFQDQDLAVEVRPVVATSDKHGQGEHQTAWREGSSTSGAGLDGTAWDGMAGVGKPRHTQPDADPTTDLGRGPNGVVDEVLVPQGAADVRVELDVTALVLLWSAGLLENHGLRLGHAAEGAPWADGAKVFASSDDADPARRPRLTIEYDLPASADFSTLIQPGPADGKDTWVRDEGLYANDNHGAWAELAVGSRTWGQLGDRRAYLQFDLASLPAGSTIVSATLDLYHASTDDGLGIGPDADVTLRAFRVIDTVNKNGRGASQTPWVEGQNGFDATLDGMAWDGALVTGSFPTTNSDRPEFTQPDVDETTDYGHGANGILAEALVSAGTLSRWHSLDITAAVQAWVAGSAPNHGIRVAHATEGAPYDEGSKHFFASETRDAPNHRPRLRVTYR